MKTETRKKTIGQVFERALKLDRAGINTKNFTIPVSFSSEQPVERFFGTEVLLHGADNVDFERAGSENGLPLLLGHSDSLLIGRVKDIKLTNKRLVGTAYFSQNTAQAREVWADVVDGFYTDTSLRYEILEVRETREANSDNDLVEITRWRPLESSVVSVPADSTVGLNRNKQPEAIQMTEAEKAAAAAATAAAADAAATAAAANPVAEFTAARSKARTDGIAAGQTAERARTSAINDAFDMHLAVDGVSELRAKCIIDGTSAEESSRMLLQYLAGDPAPIAPTRSQESGQHGERSRITGGADEAEKWAAGATESLLFRGGLILDAKERAEARKSEFMGMALGDMARHYLERVGASLGGKTRQDIAGMAFTRAGMHTSSDFASVLENVANKALMIGYDEAPETWRTWCRIGNLSDFKAASRVNISSFSDLEQIMESGEYTEGHVSDLKETIQLGKYGKLFTISREAIINDDLDAFTRIPRSMGMAANRTVGDIAYAALTGNPTLNQDSTAVFHANHANIGTAGLITETTLDEFGRLMAAQTSPAPATGETGATLNLAPRYLLVPRAIFMAAQKVVMTPTNPATAGALDVNTAHNAWEVVWDSRLDTDDAAQYYGLADQNIADTYEVAFLDGNDQPYMESRDGFTQDGVTYKVRMEAAAAALDFRGATRNAGP